MGDYKAKFESVFMKYADYVEGRIELAAAPNSKVNSQELTEEVGMVDTLCATLNRMQPKAQEKSLKYDQRRPSMTNGN